MLLSNYMIIHCKLKIIDKKIKEQIDYVEKYCIMNPSMRCKQKWMEIKALHNVAVKLKKQMKN